MAVVKQYRSKETIHAIKLADFASIPAVNSFVGLPTNIEFATDGTFVMRVIRGTYAVVLIKQGECVYKAADGALKTCSEEWLQSSFEEVSMS